MENNYEVLRESKDGIDIGNLKGSIHGWSNWKEFKSKMIKKYYAKEIDDNTLETPTFYFRRIN